MKYLVCSSATQALAHLFDDAAKKTNHKGISFLLRKMERVCRYMHHYLHADWYNRTVGQLFHEIGHAAMVELLCKDTTSTVEIYGGGKSIFGGSGYQYKYEYLSKLGSLLGEKKRYFNGNGCRPFGRHGPRLKPDFSCSCKSRACC